MKKILMCALLAFSLTSINDVQGANGITTQGEEILSKETVDQLMQIYKKDPRKSKMGNFKEILDQAEKVLRNGIGQPSKLFWLKNDLKNDPKNSMDIVFYNLGRSLCISGPKK